MKLFITFLALAALACSLQAAPAKLAAMPSQTPAPAATPAATAVMQRITVMTPTPTATPVPTVCTVSAEALNVRACPGVSCAVVAWLTAGESITTTQPITAWIYTPAGWVNSNFLECAK